MSSFTPINQYVDDGTAMIMEAVESELFDTGVGPENQEEEVPLTPSKGKKAAKTTKNTKIPATPRKRGLKAAGNKVIKNEETSDNDKENAIPDMDDSPGKKQKLTPGKKSRPIPTSLETASEEDKMLLRLKDQENKSWNEISAAWTKMTGEATKGTTLSTRYMRIKVNLAVFPKEHEALLLKVKKEIEDKFNLEKWQRITDVLEQLVGEKFPAMTLQKKVKELEKKAPAENA